MTEKRKKYDADTGQETAPDMQKAAEETGAEDSRTPGEGAQADSAPQSAGQDAAETADGSGDSTAGTASAGGGANPESQSAGQDAGGREEPGGRGSFSGRRAQKEIADLKARNEELSDKVQRQMAEFENYRKRTDKEKEQMFAMGEKNVAEKILPIVDNFERGLAALSDEEKEGAFAKGMDAIYRQMIGQLASLGVTPIECIGREFNPDYHNAVMQVESEEYEPGIIAQELQKGYMYHDTVLRHSMVGVVS